MPGWLRALVSLTCFAVLIGVGYLLWKEYEVAQRAERIADYQRARRLCLSDLDRFIASAGRNETLKKLTEHCVLDGYINADDIKRARRN
jgi:hypothetical protein